MEEIFRHSETLNPLCPPLIHNIHAPLSLPPQGRRTVLEWEGGGGGGFSGGETERGIRLLVGFFFLPFVFFTQKFGGLSPPPSPPLGLRPCSILVS